jgi:hypothetical protein
MFIPHVITTMTNSINFVQDYPIHTYTFQDKSIGFGIDKEKTNVFKGVYFDSAEHAMLVHQAEQFCESQNRTIDRDVTKFLFLLLGENHNTKMKAQDFEVGEKVQYTPTSEFGYVTSLSTKFVFVKFDNTTHSNGCHAEDLVKIQD